MTAVVIPFPGMPAVGSWWQSERPVFVDGNRPEVLFRVVQVVATPWMGREQCVDFCDGESDRPWRVGCRSFTEMFTPLVGPAPEWGMVDDEGGTCPR